MNWIELIVHTTSAGADSVSALMMECGAAGTQTEDRADIPDPSKPHGIWEIIDPKLLESMPEDVLVHAWFEEGDGISLILPRLEEGLRRLRSSFPGYGPLRLESAVVPDENWGESWKLLYHPLRAGQHLRSAPAGKTSIPCPGTM